MTKRFDKKEKTKSLISNLLFFNSFQEIILLLLYHVMSKESSKYQQQIFAKNSVTEIRFPNFLSSDLFQIRDNIESDQFHIGN